MPNDRNTHNTRGQARYREEPRSEALRGGAAAPTITVFREDETIDERGTREHVEFLIENGIEGVIACGSSGEFFAMSPAERMQVAEIVVSQIRGRVPAYIQVGEYRTSITLELAEHAESIQADGLMILPPYCAQPTGGQILRHFEAIASNVSLPIMLYNNPGVAGVSLSAVEIARLVDQVGVSSVKLTGCDTHVVQELRELCGEKLTIFYGDDKAVLEALLCGANGWISGLVNLVPAHCRRLTDLSASGDLDGARDLWRKMRQLANWTVRTDCNREPHWLSLIKTGLEIRGKRVGAPRQPLCPLDEEQGEELKALLRELCGQPPTTASIHE